MENGLGRVRKLFEAIDASSPDTDVKLRENLQLELLVAQCGAPNREITRAGRAFYVVAPTARAAVVALPTTAFLLAIYNNEPDAGRSYVIDWVSATNAATTSGAAAEAQLLVGLGQVREALPADPGTVVVKKCNGFGLSPDSRARFADNTTSPTALSWTPVGPSGNKFNVVANTSSVGYGVHADLGGRFIVAPGRYFGVTVIANATGETFFCALGWHETQTQLG